MIDLPKNFPMYCLDLKQLAVELESPKLPPMPNLVGHNALSDAMECKFRHEWLLNNNLIKNKGK